MLRTRWAVLLVALVAGTSPARARVLHVPAEFTTIQLGIDASAPGDTVLVQPGTYPENIDFNGHEITLGSLYLTTGDEHFIAETVIDGQDTGTVVRFVNGEDRAALLTGFTITRGYASGYGGGILCLNGADPTIAHNIIKENRSDDSGAGIACRGSSPRVRQNVIERNQLFNQDWGDGGGIYFYESEIVIEENTIRDNYCFMSGGGLSGWASNPAIVRNTISGNTTCGVGAGIWCSSSSVVLRDNTLEGNRSFGWGGAIGWWNTFAIVERNIIRDNYAQDRGGAIYNNYSAAQFANNLITGNTCTGSGGAIHCRRTYGRTNPLFLNNVIWGNTAGTVGGALASVCADPVIRNTILWNNAPDELDCDAYSHPVVAYSDIAGGWIGEGNIDLEPLFRSAASGDFRLMAVACGDPIDSPGIDAGDPALLDAALHCGWGRGSERSDLGAFGGGDSIMVSSVDPPERGIVRLAQNCPNPLCTWTTIAYELTSEAAVTLEVFDVAGRRISTLVEGPRDAGRHELVWRPARLTAGLYFCRLRVDGFGVTRTMVVAK